MSQSRVRGGVGAEEAVRFAAVRLSVRRSTVDDTDQYSLNLKDVGRASSISPAHTFFRLPVCVCVCDGYVLLGH